MVFTKIVLCALCWELQKPWLGAAFTGNGFCYLFARIKCHPQQGVGTENLQNSSAAAATLLTELNIRLASLPVQALSAPQHTGLVLHSGSTSYLYFTYQM